MYESLAKVVEQSLKDSIAKEGEGKLAELLFEQFFAAYPETQQYFANTDIASFGPRKFRIITEFLIDTLRFPDFAEDHIATEVFRHTMYGLKDMEYYYALVDSVHQAVKQSLGDDWSDETEEVWQQATSGMKSILYAGGQAHL